MNATPTKRRVVLGALDVNNAMNTTSPVRSLALTPSKKRDRDALKKPTTPHSLKATASPTTSRVSSLDTTPKKRAREVEQQLQLREGAKEGPTRQKQQVAGQPSPKRLCLVPSTSTTAASHAAASATAATAENEKSQSLDIDTNDDEGNVPSSVSVEQAPAQAPQQAPQQAQASPEQDREHDREEQEQDRDREQDRDQDQDQDSNSPGADSSIFDNSAHDISQSTVVTEPDVTPPPPPPAPAPAPAPAGIVVAPLATLPLPTLPPPAPSQRPAMTREEARQKAEILRLRLGLASYKVRTGQTEVPLERLQQVRRRRSPLTLAGAGANGGSGSRSCPTSFTSNAGASFSATYGARSFDRGFMTSMNSSDNRKTVPQRTSSPPHQRQQERQQQQQREQRQLPPLPPLPSASASASQRLLPPPSSSLPLPLPLPRPTVLPRPRPLPRPLPVPSPSRHGDYSGDDDENDGNSAANEDEEGEEGQRHLQPKLPPLPPLPTTTTRRQTSAPPPQRKALPSAPVPSLQAARGASFSHAPRDVNAKTKELPAAARDLLSLSRA